MLDGVEAYNSGPMTPGMITTINISAAGKQTMELIADSNGPDDYDHTNWANAMLVSVYRGSYVSDMEFSEVYGQVPAKRDLSCDYHSLTLGGKVYAKGVGAHAFSEIIVPLNAKFARFTSLIGIDDEVFPTVASIGNTIFKVVLDGVEAYNSGPMTPGMIGTIDISVAGKQTMKLIADPNGPEDYDHANWVNAMLVSLSIGLSISDMEFTEIYGQIPAKRDLSCDYHPLTLGGKVYARGVGAHASSEITVPLNARFTKFTSLIGIDDEVYPAGASIGNTIFKVLLDGDEAYNSGPMTPGMIKSIDISVAGKQTMKLIADPNGPEDYDHANWVNAMLESVPSGVSVSDMQFTEVYGQVPAKRDLSCDYNPLTLGGLTYARGIGAHASSIITVPLEAKYTRFTSMIGIDDEVIPAGASIGNTIFKVLLDDVEAYNSGPMTPGMIKIINISVAGKQTMKLIADPNGPADYDHANWANAMLTSNPVDGVYYLRARYYDPANARMLSEDPIKHVEYEYFNGQTIIDPLSLNLYPYCRNNPIRYSDPSGHIPVLLLTMGAGAIVGFAVGGVVNLLAQAITKGTDNINWNEFWISAGSGALSGALSGSGLTIFAVAPIDAFLGVGTYAAVQTVNNDEITTPGLLISAGTGALGGLIGGNSRETIAALRKFEATINLGNAKLFYGNNFQSGASIAKSDFWDIFLNSVRASASPTALGNFGNYVIPYSWDHRDNIMQWSKEQLMEIQKIFGIKQTGMLDDATKESFIAMQIASQIALNPKLTFDDFLPNGWLKPLPPRGR
jgi:RHS repeat-associated protein